MPLNLAITDANTPDLGWLYAHATLQRLFRPAYVTSQGADGREALQNNVPGLVRWFPLQSIPLLGVAGTSIFVDAYLLELETGWVVVIGGTKLLGWPHHVINALTPNIADHAYFSTYWWDIGNALHAAVEQLIPPTDTRPICFSGHSLGGAVAVVCAYLDWNRSASRPATCVTFGAPKARQADGMDGRNFIHWRVQDEFDVVPFLPGNPLPLRLWTAPLKLLSGGYKHSGQCVVLVEYGAGPGIRLGQFHSQPFIMTPFVAYLGAPEWLLTPWRPLAQHYVETYAYKLRRLLAVKGLPFHAWFDSAHAYLAGAEGPFFSIEGFPAEAPPALPPGYTPPAPIAIEPTVAEAAAFIQTASADLLAPSPGVPIVREQSLAAFLTTLAGTPLEDVSIGLAKAPLADLAEVTPDMLEHADFLGYEPFRGSRWVTTTATTLTAGRRYAVHAVFQCLGAAPANNVYAWFILGHPPGGAAPLLLHVARFASPVQMDRVRTLVIKLAVAAGSP